MLIQAKNKKNWNSVTADVIPFLQNYYVNNISNIRLAQAKRLGNYF